MHNIAIKENDENDFLIDNAADDNYKINNLHVNKYNKNEIILLCPGARGFLLNKKSAHFHPRTRRSRQ